MIRLFRPVLTAMLVGVMLAVTGLTGTLPVRAQRPRVEPHEISLRPSDLPPDFTISKEESRAMDPGPGVLYSVLLERPITPESVSTGPVMVGQFIGRFDGPVAYDGFLDEIRRRAIEQEGFEMVPGAPNDGGTASLQKVEEGIVTFEVGFIKRDMVIFTRALGRKGVVSLPSVLTLAGVSSARYDQVLAVGPTPAAPTESASAHGRSARIGNTGGSGANLRTLPHSTSELLMVVNDGDTIIVLGAPEQGSDGRKWHNVKTGDGVVGWVVSEYVMSDQGPVVAAAPSPPPPPATPAPAALVPTRTPVPPTATPKPAAAIDNRLAQALRLLYGIRKTLANGTTLGDVFRYTVESSGVSMNMKSLEPQVGGYFQGRTNSITVNSQVLNEDSRTVASILAHELTHVMQFMQGENPSRACVESEVAAFRVQIIVWVTLYNGPAPGRTLRERLGNDQAYYYATEGDPWLYKYVVDTEGYQDQCRLWVP
ncbi:MAG: SH3 domain-containing protein [Chloroflexi bacterium]|nr:SH3 domain-containing protein [Chloroflexota bacterium]